MPSVYSILNYLHEILSVNKGKRKEKKVNKRSRSRESSFSTRTRVATDASDKMCVAITRVTVGCLVSQCHLPIIYIPDNDFNFQHLRDWM